MSSAPGIVAVMPNFTYWAMAARFRPTPCVAPEAAHCHPLPDNRKSDFAAFTRDLAVTDPNQARDHVRPIHRAKRTELPADELACLGRGELGQHHAQITVADGAALDGLCERHQFGDGFFLVVCGSLRVTAGIEREQAPKHPARRAGNRTKFIRLAPLSREPTEPEACRVREREAKFGRDAAGEEHAPEGQTE